MCAFVCRANSLRKSQILRQEVININIHRHAGWMEGAGKGLVGSTNESWGPDGQRDEQRNEEAPSFTRFFFVVIETSTEHVQSVVSEGWRCNEKCR